MLRLFFLRKSGIQCLFRPICLRPACLRSRVYHKYISSRKRGASILPPPRRGCPFSVRSCIPLRSRHSIALLIRERSSSGRCYRPLLVGGGTYTGQHHPPRSILSSTAEEHRTYRYTSVGRAIGGLFLSLYI